MRSIGIRELRQNASVVLRHVEQGETFEVTDRGRPVALLTPVPDVNPLERLRALGEVSTAVGTIAELPAPLVLARGAIAPSVTLARLRADER